MTSSRIAVFAGPSRGECNAAIDFFAPASIGDLTRAANDNFGTIILADTLFLDAAPTHRELIKVLERGAKVFGCASSGALRAIELEAFGMRGYGCVYEMYRRGSLSDDGELATVLDSDFRPIAPPLVEIRYYLGYLIEQGMPSEVANAVAKELSEIYYMQRTVDDIRASIERCRSFWNPPQALKTIQDPVFRLKKIDLAGCIKVALGQATESSTMSENSDLTRAWICNGIRLIPVDHEALNGNG